MINTAMIYFIVLLSQQCIFNLLFNLNFQSRFSMHNLQYLFRTSNKCTAFLINTIHLLLTIIPTTITRTIYDHTGAKN